MSRSSITVDCLSRADGIVPIHCALSSLGRPEFAVRKVMPVFSLSRIKTGQLAFIVGALLKKKCIFYCKTNDVLCVGAVAIEFEFINALNMYGLAFLICAP